MKRNNIILIALLGQLLIVPTLFAQKQTIVKDFLLTGPMTVETPYLTDSVSASGATFNTNALMDNLTYGASSGQPWSGKVLPSLPTSKSMGRLQFAIDDPHYLKGNIKVSGIQDYALYVDGQKSSGSISLAPYHHEVAIVYLTEANSSDTLTVTISANDSVITTTSPRHFYSTADCLNGLRTQQVWLSPSGRYLLSFHHNQFANGNATGYYLVRQLSNGKELLRLRPSETPSWFDRSDLLLLPKDENDQHNLYTLNPLTGERQLLARNLPEGYYTYCEQGNFVVITSKEDGQEETSDVYRVQEPNDRQSGWRDRTYLQLYDLTTGLLKRLTFGRHSTYLEDISPDGKRLLISVSRMRLTARPTTVNDFLVINLATMTTDTLLTQDGYVSDMVFSPNGKQMLALGAMDAFGGIGLQLPKGKIGNAYQTGLFLYNPETKQATSFMTHFNPAVEDFIWSRADGMIYFSAIDRDRTGLFRLDPTSGKITNLQAKEDVVGDYSVAKCASAIVYLGQSVSNSYRCYLLNTKNGKQTLIDDDSKEILKNVELGECHDWNFVNSRGDTINGRYYLPPHFDATKRYPMIVDYYGGCTPTSKNLESRYPQHAYAAQGYVVYTVNPSGCIGFGQEFAARHVNTWGEGTADDIIEGTEMFCAEHAFVDSKRIGCIGASYGGFITTYLQTRTNLFRCAVSHAGISNITSYWGGGYWGYSYNEVAAADSYPWNSDVYTRQSPLFHADKIYTPILFIHGTEDTNVPPTESLQMFTALKLLGRECELLMVKGQNHQVLDYKKRFLWQDAIFAWFAKHLKQEPLWWDTLYPNK